MATVRRVAVAFDPGPMDLRQREMLRGGARHAEAAGWHVAIEPYARGRQGVHCEGSIAAGPAEPDGPTVMRDP